MKIPFRFKDFKGIKKTGRGYTKRELSAAFVLRELFDKHGIQSVLNVGYRQYDNIRTRWWIDICRANNIDWHILEIFEPNVTNFKQHAPSADHHRITQGDIKEIDTILPQKFDVIIHWHGPEHLLKDEYIELLPTIESCAKKMVLLGSPNGIEEQGIAFNNPNEEHISFWSEEDYQKLGYKTEHVYDKAPGHITAWKELI